MAGEIFKSLQTVISTRMSLVRTFPYSVTFGQRGVDLVALSDPWLLKWQMSSLVEQRSAR